MADITYTDMDSRVCRVLDESFVSVFRKRYVKVNGFVWPMCYKNHGQRILDMDVRDDDVWVCSYPKSGTTWTQEMVWCIGKDLDFEAAKQLLPERFPFLEHTLFIDYPNVLRKRPDFKMPPYVSDSIEYADRMASPRFIKTHLPYELLPKKLKDRSTEAKIVHVARNAKDTCLSYFHHCRLWEGYTGDFEDFCKLFTTDSLCCSPFFDHIIGYWDRRDDPHVLFLKYEDMKQDLRSVIRQTAKFLGKELLDEQVLVLEDHLSFESMKNNRSVNYEPVIEYYKQHNVIDAGGSFIRRGTVGEGKQRMSPMYLKIFDEWEEKCLAKTGLKF